MKTKRPKVSCECVIPFKGLDDLSDSGKCNLCLSAPELLQTLKNLVSDIHSEKFFRDAVNLISEVERG